MYPIKEFISKIEEKYTDPSVLPLFSNLENVLFSLGKSEMETLYSLYGDEYFIIKCDHCDNIFEVRESDLDFDWELVGAYERQMGSENEYNSTEYIDCPDCGSIVTLTLKIWEYPIGAYNYHDAEIDNGDIIEHFDFSDNFDFSDMPEVYICDRCGGPTYQEGERCESCIEEIKYKIQTE